MANPLARAEVAAADAFIGRVRELADEAGLPFVLLIPGTEGCPTFAYLNGAGCDGHALARSMGETLGRIASQQSAPNRARLVVQLESSFWAGVANPLRPELVRNDLIGREEDWT